MNCGKNICQGDLAGVEPNREAVLPGVIGHRGDTPQLADGGAHGVRAAASDDAASPHEAGHVELVSGGFHAESSRSLV